MTTWTFHRGNWRILSLALLVATLAAPLPLRAQEAASKLSFVYATKRYAASDLVSRPLIGRSVTRLTQPDSFCLEPAISADGKRIAYTLFQGGASQIWVANIDMSNPVCIAGGHADRNPCWNPAGDAVIYTTFNNGNYDIAMRGLDGSGPVLLTNDSNFDSDPSVSPDGTTIAFTSNRTGFFRLYLMNMNGQALRDLLGVDLVASVYPCFSPDSKSIAFGGRSSNGTVQLFTVGVDGNGLTQITPESTRQCSYASWSPDGRYIAYVRFERWPNSVGPNQDPADDKLGGDIMLYDTETKQHTQLTAAEGPMWGPRPAWLPLKAE